MKNFIDYNMFKILSWNDDEKRKNYIGALGYLSDYLRLEHGNKDTKHAATLVVSDYFTRVLDKDQNVTEKTREFIGDLITYNYLDQGIEQGREYVSLTPDGSKICQLLEELKTDSAKEDAEMKGLFTSILYILSSDEGIQKNPYRSILLPVYNSLANFMIQLRTTSYNMKTRCQDLIDENEDNLTAAKIEEIIGGVINSEDWNLALSILNDADFWADKREIDKRLDILTNETNLKHMVEECLSAKKFANTQEKAAALVRSQIDYVRNTLNDLREEVLSIVKDGTKFMDVALRRYERLTVGDGSMSAKIRALLSDILENHYLPFESVENIVNLNTHTFFSVSKILRTKADILPKVKKEIPPFEPTEGGFEETFNKMLTVDKYSLDNVNNNIMELLPINGNCITNRSECVRDDKMLFTNAFLFRTDNVDYNFETEEVMETENGLICTKFKITPKTKNEGE